jgi:hypothetical protein
MNFQLDEFVKVFASASASFPRRRESSHWKFIDDELAASLIIVIPAQAGMT